MYMLTAQLLAQDMATANQELRALYFISAGIKSILLIIFFPYLKT